MIKYLRMLFLIVNPLLLAFVSSVFASVFIKNKSYILMIKRIVSLVVFGFSLIAYYYLAFIVQGAALYVAMFTPLAVCFLLLIISIIIVPKKKIKEDSEKELKMTGWDTMFPNDIDNDNNFKN